MGSSKEWNEREIIQNCLKNHPGSQEILYQKLVDKMYTVCLRYATDREHAKDLLQDGFVRLFKSIGKFEFKGSFEGWARRIFVNNAIEDYRRNKKRRYSQELDKVPSLSVDPSVLHDLSMEELLKVVNELPLGYKTVFNMYVLDGYPHKEIAKELKITESTSKTQLRKARLLLMDKLTNFGK